MRANYLARYVLVIPLITALLLPACRQAPPFSLQRSPYPSQPPLAKQCGDGICDQAEQENPGLCPQDCPLSPQKTIIITTQQTTIASTPTSQINPISTPGYEPPINVFLVLHTDPLGEHGEESFTPSEGMYQRTYNEIERLTEEAARHNLRFTSLYNGWFPQWTIAHNDLTQFSALLAAGHEIGSHAHQISYDPAANFWVGHQNELSIFGRPYYNPDFDRQIWQDARDYVDAVLNAIGAQVQNSIKCSTALSLSDERSLMADDGFNITPGNRLEASVNYLGHMSWNPWRADNLDEPGHEIAEDLTSPFVSLNHGAQIGGVEAHDTNVTLPELQRQFLLLIVEWLASERTGAEDRVWAFGFVYHPNQGNRYNTDLSTFLDWLDRYFIGVKSPYGNTIARYATVDEINAEYLEWEADHPGVSSFNYVKGDPYPYTYAILPHKLAGAAYQITLDLGAGIQAFLFMKDNKPLYLLWSDSGTQTVDLAFEMSGPARLTFADG